MLDAGDEPQSADRAGGGETGRSAVPAAFEIAAIIIFLAASTTFAVITPRLGGPDERGHALYARAVSHGRLPTPAPQTRVRTEADGRVVYDCAQAHHPPVYYAIVGGIYALTGRQEGALAPIGRGLNIIAGLAALLLIRAAMHRTFPERPYAIAAGLAVAAASSSFTYVMGSFNNDPLAVLAVCAAVYLSVRALQAERPMRWMLAVGACLGAGLLTKLTAAVIVVPVATAAVGAARRVDDGSRRVRAAGLALAALGIAAVISGPWFARNQWLYGTPTFNCSSRPVFHSTGELMRNPDGGVIVAALTLEELVSGTWWLEWLLRERSSLLASVLYAQGPTAVTRSPWVLVLQVVPLLFAFGGIVRLFRPEGRAALPKGDPRHRRAVLTMLVLLPVATTLGITHQTMLVDTHIMRWPGRYVSTMIPPLGMAMGLGLAALLPTRGRGARLRRALPVAVVLAGLIVNWFGVMRAQRLYASEKSDMYFPAAPARRGSAVIGPKVAVHAADVPQVGDHLHAVHEGIHLRVGRVEPSYRDLDDLEAEAERDVDQLGVEGPAVKLLVRKDRLDGLPGEHLEAALGVADVGPEDGALDEREHLPRALTEERLPDGHV